MEEGDREAIYKAHKKKPPSLLAAEGLFLPGYAHGHIGQSVLRNSCFIITKSDTSTL
jgi:hypothetical protein